MPVNLKSYTQKIARRTRRQNEDERRALVEGRDYLAVLLTNAGEDPQTCPEYLELVEVINLLNEQLND